MAAPYLGFVGLQALRPAVCGNDERRTAVAADKGEPLSSRVALRQGLISTLIKLKMILFPALLPQFAPDGQDAFAVLLVLGLAFSPMTLV